MLTFKRWVNENYKDDYSTIGNSMSLFKYFFSNKNVRDLVEVELIDIFRNKLINPRIKIINGNKIIFNIINENIEIKDYCYFILYHYFKVENNRKRNGLYEYIFIKRNNFKPKELFYENLAKELIDTFPKFFPNM